MQSCKVQGTARVPGGREAAGKMLRCRLEAARAHNTTEAVLSVEAEGGEHVLQKAVLFIAPAACVGLGRQEI